MRIASYIPYMNNNNYSYNRKYIIQFGCRSCALRQNVPNFLLFSHVFASYGFRVVHHQRNKVVKPFIIE